MLRSILVSVAVLAFGPVAVAQLTQSGTPVSYFGEGQSQFELTDVVPTGGFVMTDVVFYSVDVLNRPNQVLFYEGTPAIGTLKFGFNNANGVAYHFHTGYSFSEGSSIWVDFNDLGSTGSVSISGYIPGPSGGAVPAVSTWGMLIMLGLVVIAGTIVFRRVKVAT